MINDLKTDLDNVISAIEADNENINVRIGSVFYRDEEEEYITLESPFSNKTDLVKSFINLKNAAAWLVNYERFGQIVLSDELKK